MFEGLMNKEALKLKTLAKVVGGGAAAAVAGKAIFGGKKKGSGVLSKSIGEIGKSTSNKAEAYKAVMPTTAPPKKKNFDVDE